MVWSWEQGATTSIASKTRGSTVPWFRRQAAGYRTGREDLFWLGKKSYQDKFVQSQLWTHCKRTPASSGVVLAEVGSPARGWTQAPGGQRVAKFGQFRATLGMEMTPLKLCWDGGSPASPRVGPGAPP